MRKLNFSWAFILFGLIALGAARWRDARPQSDSPQLTAQIRRLQSSDLIARADAAEALGKVGPAAAPRIAAVLQNGDPQVRAVAEDALGNMGPDAAAAAPALAEMLRDEDGTVRNNAAQALKNIGPAAGIVAPRIVELLADDDKGVRYAAALALYWTNPPEAAAPALVEALRDKERLVRLYSAKALAEIAPPAAQRVSGLSDYELARTLALWQTARKRLDAMDTKDKFDSTPYAEFQAAIRRLTRALEHEIQTRRIKKLTKIE